MAIDEAAGQDGIGDGPGEEELVTGSPVRVGEYSWADFMTEYGYEEQIDALYPHGTDAPDDQLGLDTEGRTTVPRGDDWERVEFDPQSYNKFHPDHMQELLRDYFVPNAKQLVDRFERYADPSRTPVIKDVYTWEHYKHEYYYDENGNPPRDGDGTVIPFDKEEALGFHPDHLNHFFHHGGEAAMELDDIIERRTVNVNEDLDEDDFFSTEAGDTTVTNRYDLEKAVPFDKKTHFVENERYWVNKPYAFVIIFHSEKENEKKYYMVEPYQNAIETDLQEFLSGKLRTSIKYSDEGIKETNEEGRREVIETETRRLLKRYDLFEQTSAEGKLGLTDVIRKVFEDEPEDEEEDLEDTLGQLEGIEVRPEPILLEEDADILNEYQVEKLIYLLKRNFIGYERIDGIKHDINVEDISCNGYNSPVFVYHSEYEQIITNIFHGQDELDDFVVKLAQRSGKGISKRLPQVDATLPDGSRAQLTLGAEVSDHGTNYTIRQFKDVPFTPIDLINWNTFSLDEMAFLWLAIENHKSLIFAGGTASGKTTSLNAVSLFIPSAAKIVSIEDTREVELPQRNWIASVTRPSFSEDSAGDIDEFDLLEAALRQRPDYIVMGEIRGEEGRTLFQVMSTGHTTYTTFHADSVDEVLKRFTTDPINVSKTMFTALDLVSIQTQTRVQGRKVRRNKSLTEINHYEAENDEINVQDVYQWQAETDEYLKMGDSNTLEEIMFDRGWKEEKLQEELFKREVILAYLIKNGLNTYAEVAATVQAFINDPDTILTLIANEQLEASLDDLREMESVLIDVDQDKEELVPRPEATRETENLSMDILERAEEALFEEYRGKVPSGLASALGEVDKEEPVDVESDEPAEFDFGSDVEDQEDDWGIEDDSTEFAFDEGEGGLAEAPDWAGDEEGGAAAASESADTADAAEPAGPTGAEFGAEATTDTAAEPTTEPEDPFAEAEATETASSSADAKAEGDDIETLFGDMGSTLEELEQADAADGTETVSEEPDETEDLFSDDDLDAMFAEAVEDQPDASGEPAEAAVEPDDTSEPEDETSIDLDVDPEDEAETETDEDDPSIELDVEPEDEAETEEDEAAIELDVEPEDEAEPEPDEDDPSIELDVEPEDEAETEEDEASIELDVEPEDEAESETEDDEASIELDVEPEDDTEAETDEADVDSAANDAEADGDGPLLGDPTDPLFDDEAPESSGSLFDDAAEPGDHSIYGDEEGED